MTSPTGRTDGGRTEVETVLTQVCSLCVCVMCDECVKRWPPPGAFSAVFLCVCVLVDVCLWRDRAGGMAALSRRGGGSLIQQEAPLGPRRHLRFERIVCVERERPFEGLFDGA